MNVHSVSTIPGRTEMELLSSVEGNFMSPQSSNSNMKIVQDSLLAMYLMTKDWVKISKQLFSHIVMNADDWGFSYVTNKINHIRKVYKELGIKDPYEYSGRFIFSMMLPDTFNYISKNKANPKEPEVKIYKGVLYEGTINKQQLNGGHYSIVHLLCKEYDVHTSLRFINDVHFCSTQFLLSYGFSIGIHDCLDYNQTEIDKVVHKGFLEADEIEKNIKNEYIRECKINGALGKTKDIGMNIVKEKIDCNNFISTITSGSKGSIFNISQITSLLGQQNVGGERIQPQLYGDRTLIHYDFEDLDEVSKYESKGFIKHSFIRGLEPEEFFFHSITGREGVIDTSLKTASSGYAQRKIIKVCEDLMVRYDGTVRNANNKIIQYTYGGDGFDPKNTIKVDGEMQFMNLDRIADKLNTEYELKCN